MKKQMKAVIYGEFGGPEKIRITTLEVPDLKEGEELVRIKAAGVNPVDYAVREG